MPEATEINQLDQIPEEYYNDELVKFLSKISKDEFTPHLVSYIESNKFTPRARRKLTVFLRNLLDREYALTKLDSGDSGKQFYMLRDKLQILKAEFPLGLTKYDMNPELQWVLSSMDMKWLAKVYRAMGGFERIRIQTHRHEITPHETPEQIEEKEHSRRRWFGMGRGGG
jgi:hypothetical protein